MNIVVLLNCDISFQSSLKIIFVMHVHSSSSYVNFVSYEGLPVIVVGISVGAAHDQYGDPDNG